MNKRLYEYEQRVIKLHLSTEKYFILPVLA